MVSEEEGILVLVLKGEEVGDCLFF